MMKIVVMGVCGCGKSSVGSELAQRMKGVFLDGDDFHSSSNRRKMASGQPLTDNDRRDWLLTLTEEIRSHDCELQGPLFLACSALKRSYRIQLRQGCNSLQFLYLKGDHRLIAERIRNRSDHFMPPDLLDSQFLSLEEPINSITVGIEKPINDLVNEIIERLSDVSDIENRNKKR
ncbi:MAG: gluconokinase [Mariniblastus sp.]|jgi:gluconokinase